MKKLFLVIITMGFILSNCVRDEKIDDFPIEKPKIVVNCICSNNAPFEFYISKSLSSIDNSSFKKVNNASIEIFENDILLEKIQNETNNPNSTVDAYFISQNKPKLGNTYKIMVSAPNLPTVTSVSKLTEEISGITSSIVKFDTTIRQYKGYTDSANFIINFKEGFLIVNIPDVANVKNNYRVNLFYEIRYWNGMQWLTDYVKWNVSSDNFNYDNYTNGIFLSDDLYDGKNIPLKIDLKYNYIRNSSTKIRLKIVVSSQSEAKQKYDISLGQYFQNQSNPFVEPALVYTNILNGYGIFGSESTTELIVDY